MFEIKRANLENCTAIQKVAEVVFPATYKEILTPQQLDYMMDWMYSTENLHKQMEQEGHIYYIAWQENTPIGYVSIQPQDKDLFHLQKIYVLPSYQGLGLGRALFERALKAIKEMHPSCCVVELNVNRNNKAVLFYERMGMRKAREGDFPIGNGFYMNDYIMAMDF